jgi:hypothetical protein
MKKYLLILLFVSIALFWACDDKEDGMSMQYEETHCLNPWETSWSQENYIVEVRSYLEDNGIKVLSIFIDVYDETLAEKCKACTCITGRNIIISVPPADVDEAIELGFTIME